MAWMSSLSSSFTSRRKRSWARCCSFMSSSTRLVWSRSTEKEPVPGMATPPSIMLSAERAGISWREKVHMASWSSLSTCRA